MLIWSNLSGDNRATSSAVPEDLRRTVTFAWNCPLDAGVAKLAASIE
jgi:hypothetical protein